MKTIITNQQSTKKLWTHLAFGLMFMLLSISAFSQTATIGSGTTATTSTGSDPINGYYNFQRYQVVYTAAELTTAGMPALASISSLGWSVSGDYGGGNLLNYTIRLGHTNATNSAAHNTDPLTQVKNPFSYNPTVVTAGNFDMITFDAPFVWDGVSNIVVDICTGSNPYTSPYGQVRTLAASTPNGSRYLECDGCGSQCSNNTTTTNTTKPQVRFSYTPPPPCSGTPVPAASAVTTAPTCANNFVVTQPRQAIGDLSYRWVESSNPAGPYSAMLIGDTLNALTKPALSSTMYYRNIITCNISGLFDTSAAIEVTPPVIVGGTSSMSVVPACASPGFTLAVTGATGGTITYQWQDSLIGGSWANTAIATASSTNATLVTTANVASPTYFRRATICATSLVTAYSSPVLVMEVAGGIAAATAPVCGDSITVSLTQNTSGAGVTYQWEESTDTISWNPIVGATALSQKVISPTVINYYRCVVTCGVATGTSMQVKVLPVKGGTTTLTSTFCGDSTALALSGASTGTPTYNWLSSTDSLVWTSMGITTATAKFPTSVAPFTFYRAVVGCGASTDTSVAVRVNSNCQGFGPYSITRSTGISYTSIQSTGTSFIASNLPNIPTNGDDVRSNGVAFPAGFDFTYAGAIRPAFYVCTNGWLSLDTTVSSNVWGNDLTATTPKLVLAPMWEDMVTLSNTTANFSLLKWEVQGVSPNRVMIVEWAEMERFNYGSPSLNFQIRMYEGSNNIEYIYGKMQAFDGANTGDFNYSIGMTGLTPSAGQKLSLLVPNTSNFSSATVNNALTMIPLCNTSYLFTNGGVFNPTTTSNRPINDSSTAPVALVVNPLPCTEGCGNYYTSLNATASNVGSAPVSGNPDDDVWFQFVAPVSGQVNITLVASSGYDPAFMLMSDLFDTTGLGNAASRNAASNALESVVASGLVSGNTYLIRVFNAGTGAGSTSGSFSICVNEVIPPPANDDTTGAFVIVSGTTCTPTAGTTLGSTASAQAVCGGLADDDVWFKFTPSASVDTVTVVGSGTFRPHVQILTNAMASVSCQNINVNGGTVKTTLTGLLKDSTYFVRVYHTNAGTASANFTICVTGDNATTPIVSTVSATGIADVVATLSGNVSASGGFPVTASGFVYGTTPAPSLGDPGVVDSANSPVVTSGAFSKNIEGLTLLTTYYYRAYATNAMGTSYGGDSSFTTLAAPNAPTINAVAATNITTTTATMGASIVNNGGATITMSGIVFGTSPNPTLSDPGVVDSTTNPVAESGTFSFTTAGLTHSTKYYFRAYAINVGGTGYSIQDSFTTGLIVTSLPYNQNFETGTAGWATQAITGTTDWQLGTPAKTYLTGAHSGSNAWATKLTGNYTVSSQSAVVSPQFDFTTSATDPIIRFYQKFTTEQNWDAMWLEISINGGAWTKLNAVLGTGTNFNTDSSYAWYSSNSVNGPVPPKFSSTLTGEGSDILYSSHNGGWIESATRLTGAAGQSNVKVRFNFSADNSTQDEGFAIDDIEIVDVTAPTTSASAVNLTAIGNNTTTVNWTNGDGQGRLVVARLTSTLAVAPTDGVLKNAIAPTFGTSVDSTGLGNYIVYKNNASTVTVGGLDILTDYTYDVYEFNGKYMHVKYTAAASNNGTTLPVTLTSFAANVKGADAILTWTTASEVNNSGFEVERSIDGRNFEKAGFVKGAGNSNKALNYSLTDAKVFAVAKSNVIYYRLKQVDFDGKFTYSQVVRVAKNAEAANALSVYPNPYTAAYSVSFTAAKEGSATIEMVDLQGKVVATKSTSIISGNNMIPMTEVTNLEAGVYFVRLTVNGETQITKLVKN